MKYLGNILLGAFTVVFGPLAGLWFGLMAFFNTLRGRHIYDGINFRNPSAERLAEYHKENERLNSVIDEMIADAERTEKDIFDAVRRSAERNAQ